MRKYRSAEGPLFMEKERLGVLEAGGGNLLNLEREQERHRQRVGGGGRSRSVASRSERGHQASLDSGKKGGCGGSLGKRHSTEGESISRQKEENPQD